MTARASEEVSPNVGYVSFLAVTAALGGFLFGFDSAVINGAISGLQRSFGSGSAVTGFAVASILLGCALGALVAGRLADRTGRRPVMLLTALLFAATAAWAGLARGSAEFTLARFVSGLAVGGASVVCPAYIAEISPASLRGRLASLQQLGIVVGIFIALLSDDLLARAAGGVSAPLWAGWEAWRWMFLVEVAPSLLFGLAVLLVPESPRYLVARGREAAALVVLTRIDPGSARAEVEDIRGTVARERAPRLADLRGPDRRLLAVVWTGLGLSVLQQLVGINSIFYYGAVLWEAVGFSSADSLRINVITGAVNIGSTLVAMAFIDRVGRRPLLLAGSVAMAAALAVMVLALGTAGVQDGQLTLGPLASRVALVAANAYVFAFGLSWGPCVWVLLAEMFPNAIRGTAMAVAVFAQWVANWLVTVTFPVLVDAAGPIAAYGCYLVFAVLSIFFVRRRVKETRGMDLEDM